MIKGADALLAGLDCDCNCEDTKLVVGCSPGFEKCTVLEAGSVVRAEDKDTGVERPCVGTCPPFELLWVPVPFSIVLDPLSPIEFIEPPEECDEDGLWACGCSESSVGGIWNLTCPVGLRSWDSPEADEPVEPVDEGTTAVASGDGVWRILRGRALDPSPFEELDFIFDRGAIIVGPNFPSPFNGDNGASLLPSLERVTFANASANAVPVRKLSRTIAEGACVCPLDMDETLEFRDKEVAEVVTEPALDNDEDVEPDLDSTLEEKESPVDLREGGWIGWIGWIGADGGREGGREEGEIVDPGEIEPEVCGGDNLPSGEGTPFRCGGRPPLDKPATRACGYDKLLPGSRLSWREAVCLA